MAAEVRATRLRLCSNEGDAMDAGRSALTEAQDRYANIETGFPLQRMASFAGLAALTTNLRHDIDRGVRSFDA